MARYIDADELLKTYKEWLTQLSRPEDKGDRTGVETCIAVLENTPTEDVVGVKHGEWNEETEYYADDYSECNVRKVYACSLCGRMEKRKEPYCNCGAKMDEEGNNNENKNT